MLTLGIETSERRVSISLFSDETMLAERSLSHSGRRHAQSLVAEVDRLFRDYSHRPSDVGLVAVSCGPGSFTGLRIGLTCAKTLAYAARASLVPIETFAAIVANTRVTSTTPLTVIADAQRGEFFVQQFRPPQSCLVNATTAWKAVGTIEIVRPDVLQTAFADSVFTGPGLERLPDPVLRQVRTTAPGERFPTARMVARLGLERAATDQITPNQLDELALLEPLYIRRSAAEDQWEARGRT